MIVIRDQQLRLLVLAHLIRQMQDQGEHFVAPDGFTDKQIAELQALSSSELVQLAEMTEPRVAIEIDAGSLEHGLRQVDYLNKRSRQLEHFIRHGATSNMLTKLFKISSADVTLKRRLFAGTSPLLRRPAMPAHAVREQIQKKWFEIRKGKERRGARVRRITGGGAGRDGAPLGAPFCLDNYPIRRGPRTLIPIRRSLWSKIAADATLSG